MADYIFEPVNTDPDSIQAELEEYIRIFHPEWSPEQAQLDYLISRFTTLKQAVVADMASRVLRGIYIYFGSKIVNIPPITAVAAQVTINFTAIDTLGHTLDAGTTFALRDSLNELHHFTIDTDAVIPGGSSSVSNVVATASIEGSQANNLSGTAEMVEQVDWLQSAVTSSTSSGGSDAESEDSYLNRLTNNFSLMAPRPVLARDFALLARNLAGVHRAAGIDNWLPGTNEQQTISHSATSGAFSVLVAGDNSGSIVWNANADTIRTALQTSQGIDPGDVVVTGGPLPATVTVTFTGRYAYTNVTQMSIANNTLSGGGGSGSLAIATTVGGVAPNAAAERAVAVAAIDESGNAIGSTLKTELDAYLQTLREQSFIVNVIDPAYTVINVTATVVKLAGADAADVDARATQAVSDFLSSAQWGVPYWPPDQRGWDVKTALRAQDLYTVLNNVDGLDYVSALTFNGSSTGAMDGNDKTLLGVFPLVTPGTINITVT